MWKKGEVIITIFIFLTYFTLINTFFTLWATSRVSYKNQEFLSLRKQWCSLLVFGGIRVVHHFSFLCSWLPLRFSSNFYFSYLLFNLLFLCFSFFYNRFTIANCSHRLHSKAIFRYYILYKFDTIKEQRQQVKQV